MSRSPAGKEQKAVESSGRFDFWERASWVERVFGLLEVAAYLAGAVFALGWIIRRFQGRAGPPDEGEQAGLWVLAVLAVLLLALIVRKVRGR